jgi:hypothetical protein
MKVLALVSKFAVTGGESTAKICLLVGRRQCFHLVESMEFASSMMAMMACPYPKLQNEIWAMHASTPGRLSN